MRDGRVEGGEGLGRGHVIDIIGREGVNVVEGGEGNVVGEGVLWGEGEGTLWRVGKE